MRPFILVLTIFSCLANCSQPVTKSNLEIHFNSKSYVALDISGVQNAFEFNDYYYAAFSGKFQTSVECIISVDTSFVLEFYSNVPEEFYLDIDKTRIPLFTSLEDTIKISHNVSSKQIKYSGPNQQINQYLLSRRKLKANHLQLNQSLYYNHKMPYKELYKKFDSLISIESEFLKATQVQIPEWFRELETQNIEYNYAYLKISIPSYRNFLKADIKYTPSEEDLAFIDGLNLNSPYNQYLYEYNNFMMFYSGYLAYGNDYVNIDSTEAMRNNEDNYTKMLEIVKQNDIGEHNFRAYATDLIIHDIKSEKEHRTSRLEYLTRMYGNEDSMVKYLKKENAKVKLYNLKTGDQAPSFYLEDLDGNFVGLEDNKGKLLLLNFYTEGCVACIKEVPFEKELQNEFEENLQIINICITDSKDGFKKAVKRFKMEGVNLYSQGKWPEILQKKYMLNGFPHYTLINQKGVIIKNHTYKPSNPKLKPLIESVI